MSTFAQTDIFADIAVEREDQDIKWGPDRSLDWGLWMKIIAEEVGEVAKEMLNNDTGPSRGYRIAELRMETVQLAAVCVAMLEQIDREYGLDD